MSAADIPPDPRSALPDAASATASPTAQDTPDPPPGLATLDPPSHEDSPPTSGATCVPSSDTGSDTGSEPAEPQLPLPPPPPRLNEDAPLLPARMVNEYAYCPRLGVLMHGHGAWEDSADTLDGRHVHRRPDARAMPLPAPMGNPAPFAPSAETPDVDEADPDAEVIHARSVTLSDDALGVIAKLDLVEASGRTATPVEYKRGKRPHTAQGAWQPERIQLALQALLLEAHGYTVPEGVIYFRGSRERTRIPIDAPLRAAAREAVTGFRLHLAQSRLPPPLVDSPKCPRCALVGLCLPDEVGFLADKVPSPRPLAVPQDSQVPLYIQAGYGKIGKTGDQLKIDLEDQPTRKVALADLSGVAIFGQVGLTTPALHALFREGVAVSFFSHGGWFLGEARAPTGRVAATRMAQYATASDRLASLTLARTLVAAKIANARTLLRRNRRTEDLEAPLRELRRLRLAALEANSADSLLGIEGAAAAQWFPAFAGLLQGDGLGTFDYTQRNRRPPRDPVNACLSFVYALLMRTWLAALHGAGLDPYIGLYHRPRAGRPALALDMMEPDRPLIADSTVLGAINNGELRAGDFVRGAGGCALTPSGRKALIAAFERRLDQELTHPLFGYRLSYRRAIAVQARLLARHLLGETESYPPITPR